MLLFVIMDALILRWWWMDRRDHSQDINIAAASRRYGVQASLIKAVVWRESRFNAEARGKAGEIGLMQIRSPAAFEWSSSEHLKDFEHEQLVDPATNTLAGTWYLRKLMLRYLNTDNPVPYALADYNAGRSHVLRWNKGAASTNSQAFLTQIDFPGTRRYILEITERYDRYNKETPLR